MLRNHAKLSGCNNSKKKKKKKKKASTCTLSVVYVIMYGI
jgi:hypothetical protein